MFFLNKIKTIKHLFSKYVVGFFQETSFFYINRRKLYRLLFMGKNISFAGARELNIKNSTTAGNYWHKVALYLNHIYFLDKGSFFLDKQVQDHIASADNPLGNAIVLRLLKSEYGSKLLAMVQDSPLGNPYLIDRFPSLSVTASTHLANVCEIYNSLRIDLHKGYVNFLDFGGGYGGLTRALLGINSCIEVTIVDMPEMVKIQQDYLSLTTSSVQRVKFFNNISSIDSEVNYDLFNASFSLSETDEEYRIEIMRFIEKRCKSFFIIFQSQFLDSNNVVLMNKFQSDLRSKFETKISKYTWYLPRNDVYVLFGKVKSL
jgi:hypothetical protein